MKGPSRPTGRPAMRAAMRPNIFASPVFRFKYFGISMPAIIALISGMPEPSTSRLTNILYD
jgi:hypothetical protein